MLNPDFIVIGAGITGVRAAIELASHGQVLVLTQSRTQNSNTEFAQGGIAVAMGGDDEVGLHYDDTIRAGNGLCDEKAVRTLVEEGPAFSAVYGPSDDFLRIFSALQEQL